MSEFLGIKPINSEQEELVEILENKKKQVVTVSGKAGTGKSLIIGAYILSEILKPNGKYKKIVFSKPMEIVGSSKYFGTVPGSVEDKYAPFLMNFKFLFDKIMDGKKDKYQGKFDKLLKDGSISFMPIELMRGVSFPKKTIVYLDEAQNIDEHMINTLGTRMESGTRLIISGDLNQVDITRGNFNSGLNKLINSNVYQKSVLTGHVNLVTVERGPVAKLFADIFEAQ